MGESCAFDCWRWAMQDMPTKGSGTWSLCHLKGSLFEVSPQRVVLVIPVRSCPGTRGTFSLFLISPCLVVLTISSTIYFTCLLSCSFFLLGSPVLFFFFFYGLCDTRRCPAGESPAPQFDMSSWKGVRVRWIVTQNPKYALVPHPKRFYLFPGKWSEK